MSSIDHDIVREQSGMSYLDRDIVREQSELLYSLVPRVSQARVTAASYWTPTGEDTLQRQLATIWNIVHPSPTPPAPPPPPPPLPTQIGPIDWNPIVFHGGVPVGGNAQLTLYQDGTVNYNGHFHCSSYFYGCKVSCLFSVRASDGVAYLFGDSGELDGVSTHLWNKAETNGAVAAGWANLCAGWSVHETAGINFSLSSIDDVAIAGAAAVIKMFF